MQGKWYTQGDGEMIARKTRLRTGGEEDVSEWSKGHFRRWMKYRACGEEDRDKFKG